MVEFMQLFPIQPPFESFTNVEAEHPNVDIFPFVRHRVLDRYQRAAQHRRSGEDCTLIIVKRTLTEPKATTAGVMPAISFARFRDTMATFNIEKTLSRPFVGWDLEAIELKVVVVQVRRWRGVTMGLRGKAKTGLVLSTEWAAIFS